MTLDQIIIALTGCTSSWMIHSNDRKVRFAACILAIIGQPAWFYAACVAQQWGILLIDAVYTLGWIRGLRGNWNV
jgi:hypothetical protein